LDNSLTVSIFLIVQLDAASKHPIALNFFDEGLVDRLEALLAPKRFGESYEDIPVDAEAISKISSLGVSLAIDGVDNAFLRRIDLPADLPYLIHTGYEVALMRSGRKPLSMFQVKEGDEEMLALLDRLFGQLVNDGVLRRRELAWSNDGRLSDDLSSSRYKYIFYTRAGHEWRVDAYKLLHDVRAHTGFWTDEYERLSGALLGYTAIEQDAWLARRRKHGLRFGFATIYCPITLLDSDLIQSSGCAGLPIKMTRDPELYISQVGLEPIIAVVGPNGPSLFARFCVPMQDFLKKLAFVSKTSSTQPFSPFVFNRVDIPMINSLIDGVVSIVKARN
jgi:hypothetical protein